MAIERLTPQDGTWTNHSLYSHQHGCAYMYHAAAMHQYRGCDVLDPYDPCRTRSLQKPQATIRDSSLPDPLRDVDRYAQRKQEQARTENSYKATERKMNSAQQEMYESLYKTQSRRNDTETSSLSKQEIKTAQKGVDYTAVDIRKEADQTAKMIASESVRAAHTADQEARDSYRYASSAVHLPTNPVYSDLKQTVTSVAHPSQTILGGAVFGAANLVAAVATCNLAAFRADMYDGEAKEMGKAVSKEEFWHRPAAAISTVTSFKDYVGAVIESKGFERAARQEAAIARDQQIATIESKRTTIEDKYKSQADAIATSSTRETDTFNKKIQELDSQIARIQNSPLVQEYNRERQEKLQNAHTTYESNKATINEGRNAALARIDRSTPIAAAQIRDINNQYDARIATLDSNHSKKVAKINATYDERVAKQHSQAGGKVAELVAQKTALTQQHQAAQAGFKSQLAGAKTERDSQLQTVRHEVEKAKADFSAAKKDIKAEGKTRTADVKAVMSGNYQTLMTSKKDYAAARSAIKHDSDGAAQLKTVLVANQHMISQFIINNTGSAQDKQLLASFLSDQHKMKQCAEKGIPFTDSMRTLSKEDTQAAQKLLSKHGASSLGSIDGNKSLAKKIETTLLPTLQKISTDKQQAFATAQKTLSTLTVDRDKLMAKSKQQGGTLSAADQQQLKKLNLDISVAKNKLKAAKAGVKESQNMIALAQRQGKQIGKHAELLAGINKLKNKRPYVSDKFYNKASKNISSSLTQSIARLNNFAQQGNVVLAADHKFQKQVGQLAKHTNFAANSIIRVAAVGTIATKMVLGIGKFGGKTLMTISSKSPFHSMVQKNLLVKFFGKHGGAISGAIGKGVAFGGKMGTKLLKLPGQVISLAGTSILDAPAMIEKKAAQLAVKGSVALVKGSTRLAVKGAVKIGRKPLKYGVRAVKTAGAAAKTGVRIGARYVGNQIGRGARFAGRQIGRGASWVARNTIGRSRIWQQARKMGGTLATGLQKIGGILGKVGSTLLKPLKAIGSVLSKIFGIISSALSAVWGGIVWLISTAVSFILTLAFGALFWLLIIILLLSVLDAIFQFFYEMTTEYRIKIVNDPSYVMNMGANYRNVELSILEFFSEEKGWSNNEGYEEKIECNDDPLYYAVFNNSFGWFGKLDTGKDINYIQKTAGGAWSRHYNEDAYEAYKDELKTLQSDPKVKNLKIPKKKFLDTIFDLFAGLCNLIATTTENFITSIGLAKEQGTFGDVWWTETLADSVDWSTLETGRFRTLVATYDKVEGFFYEGTKSNHTSTPSTYEISNAKDALAMMDAIYTLDSEMTRVKALRYMGVGEFQLSQHDDAVKNIKDADNMDNLFWRTHDIEYTDGVKAQDIVFHPQNSSNVCELGVVPQNPSDDYYGILNKACTNFSTIHYTYKYHAHVDGDPACGYWTNPSSTSKTVWAESWWTDLDNHERTWGSVSVRHYAYDTDTEYRYGGDGSYKYVTTGTYVVCEDGCCTWYIPGAISGSFYITYYPNRIKYSYTPPKEWKSYSTCPPEHAVDKDKEFKFCLGHARLAADIYVATSDPPEGIDTIYDVAKTLSSGTYTLGNGLFTWSKDLNVRGWGSPDPETINPSEEWNDSGLVSLAEGKCEEPIEYFGDLSDPSKITQIATKHGKFAKNGTQYLIVMDPSDAMLYHVLYYQENIFYMSDFMPGEQKEIEVKQETRDPGSFSAPAVTAGMSSKKISFRKSASGVYYMYVNGA